MSAIVFWKYIQTLQYEFNLFLYVELSFIDNSAHYKLGWPQARVAYFME